MDGAETGGGDGRSLLDDPLDGVLVLEEAPDRGAVDAGFGGELDEALGLRREDDLREAPDGVGWAVVRGEGCGVLCGGFDEAPRRARGVT